MDVEKLKRLEDAAYRLAGYVAELMELETTPDIIIPERFDDRDDYRTHLGNMIGSYRVVLGLAYNAIDEWQNV